MIQENLNLPPYNEKVNSIVWVHCTIYISISFVRITAKFGQSAACDPIPYLYVLEKAIKRQLLLRSELGRPILIH